MFVLDLYPFMGICICMWICLFSTEVKGSANLEILADPSNFESIHYETVEHIGNSGSFFIKSNIPVNVLQYAVNFEPNRLIPRDKALIFIKHRCSDAESFVEFSSNPIVDVFVPSFSNPSPEESTPSSSGRIPSSPVAASASTSTSTSSQEREGSPVIFIHSDVEVGDGSDVDSENAEEHMLPPSSFAADWNVHDYVCEHFHHQADDTISASPLRGEEDMESVSSSEDDDDGFFLDEISSLIFPIFRKDKEKKVKEENEERDSQFEFKLIQKDRVSHFRKQNVETTKPPKCVVTAEVLFDGCHSDLTVEAPRVNTYRWHTIEDEQRFEVSKCMDTISGILRFPEVAHPQEESTNSTTIVERLEAWTCVQAVVGRPFVDVHGTIQQAEAHVVETTDWILSDPIRDEEPSLREGFDWIQRALGEHASIASFAAFTMALMTHNAPPQLIADSLQAAMDEYNHARTSFDMASLLTQQTMAPGPLPPTTHSFEYDLKSLGMAVAKEGCVDETLSALIAAAEVQQLDTPLPFEWKDKVTVIAKEEASHSGLAWRTLYWICAQDEVICDDLTDYLEANGNIRMRDRITSSRIDGVSAQFVEQEWTRIMNHLLPLRSIYDDESFESIVEQKEPHFVALIANDILNNISTQITNSLNARTNIKME